MRTEQYEELLLPREVASMLRLKVNTVYAAATAGRLPALRIWKGRRKSLLRFRRVDIEALIAGAQPGPKASLVNRKS